MIFDYGRFGGRAHGHPAKLATIPSLNGQIVSMDYGYGWHGQPAGHGWHMRSYSHNVVVADGRDQRMAAWPVVMGRLRGPRREGPAVDRRRKRSVTQPHPYAPCALFTAPAGIVDLFLCRSETQHTYDWMFHSQGVAQAGFRAAAVPQLAAEGPLKFAL